MITKHKTNIINYLVICVNDFAVRLDVDRKSAFNFLSEHGGIEFLIDHYEIEHTLGMDEVIDDLEMICRNNGGVLL
jgi:hypothetical protein